MTATERIEMMNRSIDIEKEEKMQKAEKEAQDRYDMCVSILEKYEDRIKELILVGEKVRRAGKMKPITAYSSPKDSNMFFADGFYHTVGFMGNSYIGSNKPITHIGFYAGGACGPWDFYTDGDTIYSKHEENGNKILPSTDDLNDFVRQFVPFEHKFYTWFDETFKNGKE